MPNKIAVRLLVDRLGFEYVLVVLRDQVFESRFECIAYKIVRENISNHFLVFDWLLFSFRLGSESDCLTPARLAVLIWGDMASGPSRYSLASFTVS